MQIYAYHIDISICICEKMFIFYEFVFIFIKHFHIIYKKKGKLAKYNNKILIFFLWCHNNTWYEHIIYMIYGII